MFPCKHGGEMFAMQGPLFARLSATVSSWLAGRGGLAGDGGKRPQNVSRVTGGGVQRETPKESVLSCPVRRMKSSSIPPAAPPVSG